MQGWQEKNNGVGRENKSPPTTTRTSYGEANSSKRTTAALTHPNMPKPQNSKKQLTSNRQNTNDDFYPLKHGTDAFRNFPFVRGPRQQLGKMRVHFGLCKVVSASKFERFA